MFEKLKDLAKWIGITKEVPLLTQLAMSQPPPELTQIGLVDEYDPHHPDQDQTVRGIVLRARWMRPIFWLLMKEPHLSNREIRDRIGKKVRTSYMREARRAYRQISSSEIDFRHVLASSQQSGLTVDPMADPSGEKVGILLRDLFVRYGLKSANLVSIGNGELRIQTTEHLSDTITTRIVRL